MDYSIPSVPRIIETLEAKCEEIGFAMPSDQYIGSLLRTLVLSKPGGRFLELGTGIGLSLAWMVDGLADSSSVISVDNDPKLITIAKTIFKDFDNVELVCEDGSVWIKENADQRFDLIFADAWPGKYSDLDETLDLLKSGGLYVIDDMSEQETWPDGHIDNVHSLVKILKDKSELTLTMLDWSTGIILAVKR